MKSPINPLLLLNKKGQMAVFIVLIFQVLFVLFAMVINIGLIVHDKINLQNSVDLAAYYAAQRQAESLNVIAHQNYQIRQAWKLLSWRYFVLGTSSMRDKPSSMRDKPSGSRLIHPAAVGPNDDYDADGCFGGFQAYPSDSHLKIQGKCKKLPVICMSDLYPWTIKTIDKDDSADQFCRNLEINIDTLTAPNSIADAIIDVSSIINNVKLLNAQISQTCEMASAMQFVYASSILTAFDHEQSNRLKVLYDVAVGLSRSFDIDGKTLGAGAFKVFTKNLSYANSKIINKKDFNFKLFNSLFEKKRSEWLVPIVVNPAIIFAKLSGGSRGLGCSGSANTAQVLGRKSFNRDGANAFKKILQQGDEIPISQSKRSIHKIEGRKKLQITDFVNAQYPASKTPNFLSVGVEKNPWYRVYVGVSATTSPRELFWVGKRVTLKAVAFATPFGGRVGPWYGKTWSPGKKMSDGSERKNRVDKLLPPRDLLNGGSSNSKKSLAHEFVPNFSRFPGDKMGLFSSKALAAVQLGAEDTVKFSINNLLKSAFSGDPLKAQSTLSQKKDNRTSPRNMELAAISPNFFDITYYSVFPDARSSFMKRLFEFSTKGDKKKIVIRDDVGNYKTSELGAEATTLIKRIEQLGRKPFGGVTVNPKYGNFITDPKHLLTAWLPNGPYKYDEFNKDAFQQCSGWVEAGEDPVMGACPSGGRVGYSVKIISKNVLNSSKLKLGGEEAAGAGPLENPPRNWPKF